jgi:hypothetical protein
VPTIWNAPAWSCRGGTPGAHRVRRLSEKYKQESHEALGGNFLETFLEDLRFSLRKLRKSPGIYLRRVLTLALAIGANAVVFSMFNGLFCCAR